MNRSRLYDAEDAIVTVTPGPDGAELMITKPDGPYDLELACTLSASVLRTLLADVAAIFTDADEDAA